jgi:hypothetical protein
MRTHEARRPQIRHRCLKERKRHAGIFAIHCDARREIWVESVPDLATIRNRIWFTLKHGGPGNIAFKAAHAAHGEAGLRFEILEQIEDEDDAHVAGKVLLRRARHWRDALAAQPI